MTISRRLLLILAILITGIQLVSTVISAHNQSNLLHRLFNERVTLMSAQLSSASTGGLKWGQSNALESVYNDFMASGTQSRLEAYFALKPDGTEVFVHNEDPEHPDYVKKYLALAQADGDKPTAHTINESDHVASINPILTGDDHKLIGYVITFWNDNHLEGIALRQAAIQGIASLILTLLALAALSYIIRRMLVAPVNNLVKMASSLAVNLDGNVQQIKETTSHMSANAQNTLQKTNAVLQNSSQTAANVQQVAAGAEQLAASLQTATRTIEASSGYVSAAQSQAIQSKEVVESLAEASQNIAQFTTMITEIAEQTNLLALNASIEAARAGDAGRGFAVVADEIKKLATTTTQATGDITKQVQHITSIANSGSQTLSAIADTVGQISGQTATIREAVNEQSVVTQDISRNMHEASSNVQQVDNQLSEVNHAASSTGDMAQNLLESVTHLKTDSDKILHELTTFGKRI